MSETPCPKLVDGRCELIPPGIRGVNQPAVCGNCRLHWPGGKPPTEPTYPVAELVALLTGKAAEFYSGFGIRNGRGSPLPDSAKAHPRCSHLGKVVNRQPCNCWQKSDYRCDALTAFDPQRGSLPIVVLPERDCAECPFHELPEDDD